jgi:hypothetical protein
MEDVLDLYQQPYDPLRPVVCMDETSKQLVAETRKPLGVKAGRPRRVDYEYERRGTADVFVFTEPLRNWRSVSVTEQRTRLDWAHKVKELVDERYPDAEVIRLVMDNLNTHSPGSLYEAFPAVEARRLTKKLEIHFTPKHGSWLNIAEIELRALTVQCLDRRIPDIKTLAREVAAWERARNRSKARVDWQFATDDARIKLKHLYPRLQS